MTNGRLISNSGGVQFLGSFAKSIYQPIGRYRIPKASDPGGYRNTCTAPVQENERGNTINSAYTNAKDKHNERKRERERKQESKKARKAGSKKYIHNVRSLLTGTWESNPPSLTD